MRRTLDRILTVIAGVALRGFFRDVEVEGRDRIPSGRPILVVANHFNGFVDPVGLIHVFRRLPRFLAKGTLWKVVPARPFLKLAGIIPVYRPEDREGHDNTSTFAACHEVLREKGLVGIFPEGTTHDTPFLAKVRTGAARIALGAHEQGVEDIQILPVGLTFEDKLALRSRVVAQVGEPIDLDTWVEESVADGQPAGEENHDAVDQLTETITDSLRAVSPDFADNRERKTLELAAKITLRTDLENYRQEVALGPIARLSKRLGYAALAARLRVLDSMARYNLDLTLAGLGDKQLVPGYTRGQVWPQFILTTLVLVVLSPVILVGTVVNAIPYWLTKLAGRRPAAPVSKGTVRLLVGLGAFLLTWIVYAVLFSDGWFNGFWLFISAGLFGWVTVVAYEQAVKVGRAFRGWSQLRNRRALVDPLLVERAELLAAVDAAVADPEEGRPCTT